MIKQDNIQQNISEESPAFKALNLPFVEDLPDPIPLDRLSQEDFLRDVKGMKEEIIRTENRKDANQLLKKLRRSISDLKSYYPDFYTQYSEIILELEFFTLSGRNKESIKRLFRDNLLWGMRKGFDLRGAVEELFYVYEDTLSESGFRTAILEGISQNKEILGNKVEKMDIEGEDVPLSPGVMNWIKDYNRIIPLSKRRGVYEEVEYLNKSKNVKKLGSDEKRVLQRVIALYDWVRFPPRALRTESTAHGTPKATIPAAPKPKRDVDETLYRSTLDEINEMRETYEKEIPNPLPTGDLPKGDKPQIPVSRPEPPRPPVQKTAAPSPSASAEASADRQPSPARGEGAGRPYSVNESVVHGDYHDEHHGAGIRSGKEDQMQKAMDRMSGTEHKSTRAQSTADKAAPGLDIDKKLRELEEEMDKKEQKN